MPTLVRHYPGFVDEPEEGPEEVLVRSSGEVFNVPWVNHWSKLNHPELTFLSWHREICHTQQRIEEPGPRRGLLIARMRGLARVTDMLIATIDDVSILWDVQWARRPSEVYAASPIRALELKLIEGEGRYAPPLVYCALAGKDGTTYGSYHAISRHHLKDRSYRVDFIDETASIFWTDALHNPRTHQNERT